MAHLFLPFVPVWVRATVTICNFDEESCISLGSPERLQNKADSFGSKGPPNKRALTAEGAFRRLLLSAWT